MDSHPGSSDTVDDDETGRGHCALGNAVRWNHRGPAQATSTRSTESYDMEPSTTALNNTTVVFFGIDVGVGMADDGGS